MKQLIAQGHVTQTWIHGATCVEVKFNIYFFRGFLPIEGEMMQKAFSRFSQARFLSRCR